MPYSEAAYGGYGGRLQGKGADGLPACPSVRLTTCRTCRNLPHEFLFPRGAVSSSESVIEFRKVTKRFGDVVAVADNDLAVKPGEFLSILGPSGCGKTTTDRKSVV